MEQYQSQIHFSNWAQMSGKALGGSMTGNVREGGRGNGKANPVKDLQFIALIWGLE